MKDSENEASLLSAAEWEVMKVIWERGPSAARDVFAGLPETHGWTYTTVKTMLSRLVAKGALDYEQVGNSYLYRAVVKQEAMARREVRGVLQRLLQRTVSPILAHFIQEANLTEEDIQALQKTLDDKKKRTKKGGRSG